VSQVLDLVWQAGHMARISGYQIAANLLAEAHNVIVAETKWRRRAGLSDAKPGFDDYGVAGRDLRDG